MITMEMDSTSQEKKVFMLEKLKAKVIGIAKETKKIGKDDPRRIIHSAKVGLALTLVSLFYYFRPLYDGFGQAGMWAVLTVVVVFEFSVGATLCKSLNRGFATLVAGGLGVGAEYLAELSGKTGEPIILGFFVFILATASTFARFFPNIKRRYDYGVLIFILTFSLVAVSGYRVDEIFQLAHQRLSTIMVGAATCMVISIFICPVWAGEDLHNLIASNIENLASFLEGFGGEYFNFPDDEVNANVSKDDKSFVQGYKSVLNSKATEESLANAAWWEPGHGRLGFRHPWKQYLKIGALTRLCACQMEALSGYINSKREASGDFQKKIQEPCTRMISECGKALKELASSIKIMTHPSSAIETHIHNSKIAIDDFKTVLESTSLEKVSLLEIIPAITVASILIDTINCVEKISEAIDELSNSAHFIKSTPKSTVISPDQKQQQQQQVLHRGIVLPVNDAEGAHDDDHVVIAIRGISQDSPEIEISQAPKKGQQVKV